ncbi:MAG: S41 family peptidase [Nitritalea sp.]
MKKNTRISLYVLSGILAAGLLFSFVNKNDRLFAIAKHLDIFASLIRELDSYYVDEIDPEELITAGMEAMLSELDPYTELIPEENSDDFRMMTTGEYGGVGALIGNRTGTNIIIMPYSGWPAQEAGLMIGDELLRVDSTQVVDKETADISRLLKGPANTPVRVEVKRGDDTLRFELTRRKIVLNNVPYYGKLNEEVGYIKLTDFTTNAGQDVRRALVALKEQGISSLVLDLRDNPGGIMKEAVEIVNLFVPKGREVVSTRGKMDMVNTVYKTSKSPLDKEIPLAVLINERSASAAEIVAGALQDYDRAILIGRKTFGKGLVQTTIPLSYNAQVKVTTARYYIPSGRCVQAIDYSRRGEENASVPDSLRQAFKTKNGRTVLDGAGIEPDVEVDAPTFAPITFSLVARSHVFNFATAYSHKNPKISGPREFQVSDALYAEFVDWLADKEYDYTTYVEKSLEDLEKYAKREQYFEEIEATLAALKEKITHSKEQDLVTHKAEVKRALREEIISRYYFQEGVVQASLDEDEEIKKAIALLGDAPKMKTLLAGK